MDMIIMFGFCVALLCLILFFYVKDRQTDAKFERFGATIEQQTREIFELKKENENLKKMVAEFDIGGFAEMVEQQLNEKVMPVVRNLQFIESAMQQEKNSKKDEFYINEPNEQAIIDSLNQ